MSMPTPKTKPLTSPEWRAELDDYHRMEARGLLLIVWPCHRDPTLYRWKATRAGALVGPSMMHPDAEGLSLDVAKARAMGCAMGIADDDAEFWEAARLAHKAAAGLPIGAPQAVTP